MKKETKLRRLKIDDESDPNIQKKGSGKKFKVGVVVVILIIAAVFWSIFSTGSAVFTRVFSQGETVKSTDKRVNILLLGMAGGKHDGALLTDSIIVASYNLENNYVTLISIPRDLWMDSIKYKVNAVYEVGLRKANGGDGLKYAEENLDDILGIPIHYAIRIDFAGFAKAVDLVGGIEVDIPKAFDDYKYPIEGKEIDLCDYEEKEVDLSQEQIQTLNLPSPLPSHLKNFGPEPVIPGKKKVLIDLQGKIATEEADFNCRYEHISFQKGLVKMDGATALKFVRSRQGTNGEGSDFARSRRQQLVLQAFRTKVLSLETLANPVKITGLMDTLGKSVETDIPVDKISDFYKLAQDMKETQSLVLGDLGAGKSIFVNPPVTEYGQWVLIPPDNNFDPVKDYIKLKLTEQDASGSAQSK